MNYTFKEGVLGFQSNAYLYNQPSQQISLCSCDLGVQLRGVTDDITRRHACAGAQLAFGSQTENKMSVIHFQAKDEKKNSQKIL